MAQIQHWFVAAAIPVLLSGCVTSVVPLNFSVPNVGVSQRKIDAELRSVIVTVAPTSEISSGTQDINTTTVTSLWTSALTDALNRMAIFQDDATRKVNLSVKILTFEPPGPSFPGASVTTKTTARYEIIDRRNGDIIYTQDVSSSGTGTVAFSLDARTQGNDIRDATNRAVHGNIAQFLQALESVDVKKPMFPAKAGPSK